jgi:glyoxylase-like metal-dependent hydrolase (beta-lactamase superfamily II)
MHPVLRRAISVIFRSSTYSEEIRLMEYYKIFAIEYERRQALSTEIFLRAMDPEPAFMSYYIWAIVGSNIAVIVDTGYTEETALSRGRKQQRCPGEGLKLIGIQPDEVEQVIITHFHWDHLGNHALFPKATFYAQEKEMAFWTGRYASVPIFREVIEPDDIVGMVRLNLSGHLTLIDGSRELFPGISVHWVGGHTPGMQIVEVATAGGTAVIASDAVKTYRNLTENIPDPYVNDISEMIDGYELVRSLAENESLVFPGHDPEVFNRFSSPAEGIAGLLQG